MTRDDKPFRARDYKLFNAAGQWAAACNYWANPEHILSREETERGLRTAALAYARPIVAEECASIIKQKTDAIIIQSPTPILSAVLEAIVTTGRALEVVIREHGKTRE